jgi:hypothetical protein
MGEVRGATAEGKGEEGRGVGSQKVNGAIGSEQAIPLFTLSSCRMATGHEGYYSLEPARCNTRMILLERMIPTPLRPPTRRSNLLTLLLRALAWWWWRSCSLILEPMVRRCRPYWRREQVESVHSSDFLENAKVTDLSG